MLVTVSSPSMDGYYCPVGQCYCTGIVAYFLRVALYVGRTSWTDGLAVVTLQAAKLTLLPRRRMYTRTYQTPVLPNQTDVCGPVATGRIHWPLATSDAHCPLPAG